MKEEKREAIIDLLINKAALKQDIADYSEGVFESFKVVVEDELKELAPLRALRNPFRP